MGGVFGAVVTIACANGSDYGGSILFTANPFLTIFICMLKGILAGAAAGGVYNLAAKKNVYLGVFLAAVAAPVVNTGLFCLSLELFFRSILVDWAGGKDLVYYIFVVLVGVNFYWSWQPMWSAVRLFSGLSSWFGNPELYHMRPGKPCASGAL